MDDGLGFSIGALFGGFLFQKIGGKQSFRVFAIIALITCIAHFILRPTSTHETRVKNEPKNVENSKKADETMKEISFEEKKLTEELL